MKKIILFVSAIAISSISFAALYKMEFTAQFGDESLRGSFGWLADSAYGPIQDLLSVNFIVEEYAFNLEEIGFVNRTDQSVIGGAPSGFELIESNTYDFQIGWIRSETGEYWNPYWVAYAVEGNPSVYIASEISEFTIRLIPLPAASCFFLSSIATLVAFRFKC